MGIMRLSEEVRHGGRVGTGTHASPAGQHPMQLADMGEGVCIFLRSGRILAADTSLPGFENSICHTWGPADAQRLNSERWLQMTTPK